MVTVQERDDLSLTPEVAVGEENKGGCGILRKGNRQHLVICCMWEMRNDIWVATNFNNKFHGRKNVVELHRRGR